MDGPEHPVDCVERLLTTLEPMYGLTMRLVPFQLEMVWHSTGAGAHTTLLDLPTGDYGHYFNAPVPMGKRVVFTIVRGPDQRWPLGAADFPVSKYHKRKGDYDTCSYQWGDWQTRVYKTEWQPFHCVTLKLVRISHHVEGTPAPRWHIGRILFDPHAHIQHGIPDTNPLMVRAETRLADVQRWQHKRTHADMVAAHLDANAAALAHPEAQEHVAKKRRVMPWI